MEALAQSFPTANPARTLTAVMAHIASLARADPDLVRGWALATLRDIHRRAIAMNDLAAAIRATKTMVDLAERNRPTDDPAEPEAL